MSSVIYPPAAKRLSPSERSRQGSEPGYKYVLPANVSCGDEYGKSPPTTRALFDGTIKEHSHRPRRVDHDLYTERWYMYQSVRVVYALQDWTTPTAIQIWTAGQPRTAANANRKSRFLGQAPEVTSVSQRIG
ncbi:hypothetical protein MTO96_012650 [Rhipicephalus appendiculatus]